MDGKGSVRQGREVADDNAEDAVLNVLERRREQERQTLATKRDAEAERDILSAIPTEASANVVGADTLNRSSEYPRVHHRWNRPTFSSAAHRVMQISRIKRVQEVIGEEASTRTIPHDILASTAHSSFLETGPQYQRESCADLLFDELQRVEEMYHETPIHENEDDRRASDVTTSSPYLSPGIDSFSRRSNSSSGKNSSAVLGAIIDEEAGEKSERSSLLPKSSELHHRGFMKRFRSGAARSSFKGVLGPRVLCKNIFRFFITRFLFVMVPLVVAAYFLYTYENIELDFLPSHASLSWWLIFLVRQLVTFQLAICTEYIIVDALALRSAVITQVMGPLFTLYAMQAKGWPFIISCWGTWDLLLLHGTSVFARNWLYFLNIGMFSDNNLDGGIMGSELYLRILLSVVLTGVSVGIKRTYLALALGRRTFLHFRGRLEVLLANIRLISEVGNLAHLTTSSVFEKAIAATDEDHNISTLHVSKRWQGIKFLASDSESSQDSVSDEENESDMNLTSSHLSDTSTPSAHRPVGCIGDSGVSMIDESAFRAHYLQHKDSHTSSGGKIKDLLERWEEPHNKKKKDESASIHDILQFRKALAYMDDSHPFSASFGPSDNRDRCIKSAQKVYQQLLKFAPESDEILPFEVLGALAYDEEGNVLETKKQALVKLFRPDRHNQITMLAFVQTCDWVYRKLRFFRASVANSSLIDGVLEQIFNFFFYTALALVITSGVMGLNPWSLLLSVSTLLVSLSFAVGSSVSKLIEGILLIAVRRPFDLGDRISLSPADAVNNPDGSLQQTWFVEDVNLFSTTLRFVATNEVSTINNGAIANSRIVNFARSPGALVTLDLLLDIKATQEQMLMFRKAVKKYIRDNPRTWSSIIHFRTTQINPDMEFVGASLRLQHMKSWQETTQVLNARGNLHKFCIQAMEELGIVYSSPGSTVNVKMRDPGSRKNDKAKADTDIPRTDDRMHSAPKDE